jgi:hypothetical protein
MLWIRRNLFIVVGGLVALALLGWSVVFLLQNLNRKKALEEEYAAKKSSLDRIYGLNPFPSDTNIAKAKGEHARVQEAVAQARKRFVPIPYEKVSGPAFKTLLDNTVFEMRKKAEAAGVGLPAPSYAFTFETQKNLVKFAEGSFPALPERLAEIKVLCDLLFDAKINQLVELRRERVSKDDAGAGNDYHSLTTQTNAATGAVQTPYEITFLAFSSELAKVLESVAKSPHGLIAKVLMVDTPPEARAPGQPAPGQPAPPGRTPPPGARPAAPPSTEPVTVLSERRLKITLVVDVVKPPA